MNISSKAPTSPKAAGTSPSCHGELAHTPAYQGNDAEEDEEEDQERDLFTK
jgi:hypothetical protein